MDPEYDNSRITPVPVWIPEEASHPVAEEISTPPDATLPERTPEYWTSRRSIFWFPSLSKIRSQIGSIRGIPSRGVTIPVEVTIWITPVWVSEDRATPEAVDPVDELVDPVEDSTDDVLAYSSMLPDWLCVPEGVVDPEEWENSTTSVTVSTSQVVGTANEMGVFLSEVAYETCWTTWPEASRISSVSSELFKIIFDSDRGILRISQGLSMPELMVNVFPKASRKVTQTRDTSSHPSFQSSIYSSAASSSVFGRAL
jgi:hypothetical protein